ncbi:unnamed protein product [Spodoptera exigua]|nr:unnamed protein product [Spodoptera exigua]
MLKFYPFVIIVLILHPVNLTFFNLSVNFSPYRLELTTSSHATENSSHSDIGIVSKPACGVESGRNRSCVDVKSLPSKLPLFINITRKLHILPSTTSKLRERSLKMVQYITETPVNTGSLPTGVNMGSSGKQSLPETVEAASLVTTHANIVMTTPVNTREVSIVKHSSIINESVTMKPRDVETQGPVHQTAVTRRDGEQLKRGAQEKVRRVIYQNYARPYTARMYSRGLRRPQNKWNPYELSKKIHLNQRAVRTLSTYPFFPGGTTPTRQPEPTEIMKCGIAKCIMFKWTDVDEGTPNENGLRHEDTYFRASESFTSAATYKEDSLELFKA